MSRKNKKARKQPAPLPLMVSTPIQKPDNVNHPSHYQGKRECIEVMRKMFGDEAVKGFCKCNAYKYRFRAGRKGSAEEDIKKAEWYEEYLFRMENEG